MKQWKVCWNGGDASSRCMGGNKDSINKQNPSATMLLGMPYGSTMVYFDIPHPYENDHGFIIAKV